MEINSLNISKFGRSLRRLWLLDPDMFYLNHGSFGATPRPVLEAQSYWREQMERQPVDFLVNELAPRLREAAGELAEFLGAEAAGLVFVDNATAGANTVLNSIAWKPDDEILVCRYVYLGVKNAVEATARKYGVNVRYTQMPFPVVDQRQLVDAFCDALNENTRLVIVDHVSSPTSVVFPVNEIIAQCRQKGIATLVDGAHAPGMLALNISELKPDYYVANCHKWLCAPKGCGFIWAAAEYRHKLHPLTISTQWGKGYAAEFDWAGTRDPSVWLAVTAAIKFIKSLDPDKMRHYNHKLVIDCGMQLAQQWGVELPAAETLLAAMQTLPLPFSGKANLDIAKQIHDLLWREYRIEVPILYFDERLWLRISGQVYNEHEDYLVLADAVPHILKKISQ